MRRSASCRRRQSLLLETRQDEAVDGIANPLRGLDLGRMGPRRGREGPVLLPRRSLLDPTPHHLDLILRQLLVGVFGRHPQGGIRVSDPLVDEARLRVPRRDRRPGRPLGEDSVFQVQPQIRQPGLGVRAVALETGVGKDGPHLRLKVHRRLVHRGARHGRGAQRRNTGEHRYHSRWKPSEYQSCRQDSVYSTRFPCLSHYVGGKRKRGKRKK